MKKGFKLGTVYTSIARHYYDHRLFINNKRKRLGNFRLAAVNAYSRMLYRINRLILSPNPLSSSLFFTFSFIIISPCFTTLFNSQLHAPASYLSFISPNPLSSSHILTFSFIIIYLFFTPLLHPSSFRISVSYGLDSAHIDTASTLPSF